MGPLRHYAAVLTVRQQMEGRIRWPRVRAVRVNYWNSSSSSVREIFRRVQDRMRQRMRFIGGRILPSGAVGLGDATSRTWNYGVVAILLEGRPLHIRNKQVPEGFTIEEGGCKAEFVRGPYHGQSLKAFVADAVSRLSEEAGGRERLVSWSGPEGPAEGPTSAPVGPAAGEGSEEGQVRPWPEGWGSWDCVVQLAKLEEARAKLAVAQELAKVREMERRIAENHVCPARTG